jgi:hypothetical protein
LGEATPIHSWLLPRLLSLVREAEQAGFDRAAVVAVIDDLITAPPFNDAGPGPDEADG